MARETGPSMNRRVFLRGAGAITASTMIRAAVAPSDQIIVGVIGAGGRGQVLMDRFAQDPSVRLAAVCDVYEPNLEAGLSIAKGKAKAYRHYQELLADKS